MEIKRIDYDDSAIIVLGAGATRGASFVPSLKGALPPLDTDFFTQAQRLSSAKPSSLIEDVLSNTVRLFGENFHLTMEGFLTHIEHFSHVHEDYKLQGRPAKNTYDELRMNFLQLLAAVLDETVGKNVCTHHDRLVEVLSTKDAILSFNYDWLIDLTLKRCARGKWSPSQGYGVSVYKKSSRFWACEDEQGHADYPSKSLKLLKLHGSMTWFPVPTEKKDFRLKLRQRWWHQNGGLVFEIAPPEWNKPIRSGIYKHVWRTARKVLRKTTTLVFIGYSLPETDLPARALFMVDAGPNKTAKDLQLLVVVNPDRAARWRIRNVLSGRIVPQTRIVTFDSFAEFANFLG